MSRGVTVNVPTIEKYVLPIQIKPNFVEASAAKRYFLLSPLVCVILMPTIQNPHPPVWNAKPEAQTKTRRSYRRRQDNSKHRASQVEPIEHFIDRHKCPNEL